MEQQAETLTAVHGCACLVLCSCTSFSRCTRRWQERLPRQAYPGVLRAAASHGLYSFSRFNQIIESVKKRQMFLSFCNRHDCCLEPFWIGMYLALFTGTKLLWHNTRILFSLSNKHLLSGHFWDPPKTISKTSKSWTSLKKQPSSSRSQPMSGSYTSFSWISQGFCNSWNSFSPMEVVYIFQKGTSIPVPSMYGIFTYIWLICMVNVGKYTIHGWYGIWWVKPLGFADNNMKNDDERIMKSHD